MDRLFQSVQIGDTDSFRRFIKDKSAEELNTPDLTGTLLIHYAVEGGFLDICQGLVKHKASINVVNREDESPLHIAAKKQFVDICSFLLKNGAILDAKIQFYILMIFQLFYIYQNIYISKFYQVYLYFLKTNLQCQFIMPLKMDALILLNYLLMPVQSLTHLF